MAKWWRDVFLPFVRLHLAMRPVLLIMDNCGSHASDEKLKELFKDDKGLVDVGLLPPNTTPVWQPMDAGIIAYVPTSCPCSRPSWPRSTTGSACMSLRGACRRAVKVCPKGTCQTCWTPSR